MIFQCQLKCDILNNIGGTIILLLFCVLLITYLVIMILAAFIDNPASLSVNRGELVNLNCSYPLDQSEVNISWNTPPDINMTPVDESDTNINITKSTLVFTAMDSTYAGDYFCMVYMDGYSVNSAVGILSLDCKSA